VFAGQTFPQYNIYVLSDNSLGYAVPTFLNNPATTPEAIKWRNGH
jgi:hypothetical protein